MKVGDYVRFYDRSWTEIGQIVGEVEDSHLKVVKCIDGYYDLDGFIKSSPNIIDLVEVGDVLIVKEYCDEACQIFTEIYLIQSDDQLLNIKEDLEKNKNHKLYSIVTKEQFSQMEYRIGG